MAERLVAEAYKRGGTDNITAVVVRVLDVGNS
jgi:serine/threonine protein phosphatase PrpC